MKDCCEDRDAGGVNLVDLGNAIQALLLKWIVKALEPCLLKFTTTIEIQNPQNLFRQEKTLKAFFIMDSDF